MQGEEDSCHLETAPLKHVDTLMQCVLSRLSVQGPEMATFDSIRTRQYSQALFRHSINKRLDLLSKEPTRI